MDSGRYRVHNDAALVGLPLDDEGYKRPICVVILGGDMYTFSSGSLLAKNADYVLSYFTY